MNTSSARWYRRLQVQLWLWAILPVTLVLVAVAFTGLRSHEVSMHHFVTGRDLTIASLLARQIDDSLSRGVLGAGAEDLAAAIGDGHIGQRGVIYVIDGTGRVLFHPDPGTLGRDLSGEVVTQQALASAAGAANGTFPDGSPTIASYAAVGATGWRVVVEEPVENIIVPVLRFSSVLPALVAVTGLLSLIVIYFSVRTIVRPLQRLSERATRITGGELSDLGELQQEVGGVEEIRQLSMAVRDMVERIRRYQDSTRGYIDGITHSQEMERARLSRELHDETMQTLVAVDQRVQLAQRAVDRGEVQSAAAGLEQVRTLCLQALDELRRTVRALRPVYLDDLGLFPALHALVDDVRARGLPAELVVRGVPRRLEADVEMAVFRIAQEALSNVLRHAQAQRVDVEVGLQENALTLSIQDDGQGFEPPENPQDYTEAGHYGIVGMRERVLLLNGRLEISAAAGGGTRITAQIPL
jgi:signal transduction histidine kinase